jgi:hypothetical protein
MKANEQQVGGSHYGGASWQHWDFCVENDLRYLEGTITKYVARWKDKAGRQDLEKALHYAEKLYEVNNTFWGRLGFLRNRPKRIPTVRGLDEMTSLYRLNATEREIFRLAVEYKNLTELKRTGGAASAAAGSSVAVRILTSNCRQVSGQLRGRYRLRPVGAN